MKKAIVRVLSIGLAAALLCGAVPLAASAKTDITDKFTDSHFRAVVQELVGKKKIYDTDAAWITRIDIGSNGYPAPVRGRVKSLAGLEYLTGLMYLDCGSNKLTSLPKLPAGLIELVCWDNQLTQLPKLPAGLLELCCDHNQLTQLPKLPLTLTMLSCSWNQLTSLPQLPEGLGVLDCSLNKLSALPELSAALEGLDCSYNELTTLPELPVTLDWLWCNDNALTALPALPTNIQGLDCSYNQLTGIDVTGVLQLQSFDCSRNNMTSRSAVKGFKGDWDALDEFGYPMFIYESQNVPQIGTFNLWCKPTTWEKTPLNWFLLIACFGWLWMAF